MKLLSLVLAWLLPVVALAIEPSTYGPFMLRSGATDWEMRVVANGGAQPSANTVVAMETLRLGCIAAGLTNKIHSLCVFVPDSLIAATTPLFKHFGSDPWTNNNFLSGDLTVNGLKGNGTTKSLDTGVKSKDVQIPANSATIGITVLVTESSSNAQCVVIGQQQADDNRPLLLSVSSSGSTLAQYTSTTVANQNLTNDFGRVGYVSANRYVDGGNTNISIYVASPLESHKTLDTKVSEGNQAVATLTDDTISIFAYKHGGTNSGWAPLTMSLAMVHDGFTAAESAAFWTLALACRQTLGGGTGDNIHDYNRKIVAFGGAAISTTTSNALRTFYSGLDSDAVLYRIVSGNVMLSDNLTAARTPVIWKAGSEIWGNVNFAASNLSTAGLTGDGTSKYLTTGVTPSTVLWASYGLNNAGLSILRSAGGAGGVDIGSHQAASAGYSYMATGEAGGSYYAWRNVTVNTDYVVAGGIATNGFFSGNRTAVNSITLYNASTNTAFQTLTNGTGSHAGVIGTQPFFAFAFNLNATPGIYSARTLSFIGITTGLTSTQSSNLYNRVSALRQTLGGGNP